MKNQITNTAEIAGITYEVENGIATITLNRPNQYNTLTEQVILDLTSKLDEIACDKKIKVLIIAASGKAFSTGHDLKDMLRNNNETYFSDLLQLCSSMMQKIVVLPQPVIAQVQGIATAAGCQLVATCDLAVAGESSIFATNGIVNGLYCATPSVALSRVVPKKVAMEMLLTGDFISSQKAERIGLINKVTLDENLVAETKLLAQKIADKAQFAVRLGKTSFNKQLGKPLTKAYDQTSADLVCNLLSPDGQEGLSAFSEKRQPKWEDS
jgi:enoyl-CoA hydratase/carnithine racemase